jgi:hypothetical protein
VLGVLAAEERLEVSGVRGIYIVVGNSPRTLQMKAGARSRRRSFLRRAVAGPGRLGEGESVLTYKRKAGYVCCVKRAMFAALRCDVAGVEGAHTRAREC